MSQNSQAEYTRLTQVIGSNIKKISGNVPELNKLIENLKESGYNNADIWSRLQQRQRHTSGVVLSTNTHFKRLRSLPLASTESDQRQRRMQTERLTKEFEESINSFKSSQKEISSIEKQMISKLRSQTSSDSNVPSYDQTTGDIQLQQQQPLLGQEELDAIKKRQEEFLKLEEDIMAVNEIFNDLSLMVEEQGEVIDRIEDNLERGQIAVTVAAEELGKAKESKKKSRKKKICCGVIIGVAILILILAIFFSVS